MKIKDNAFRGWVTTLIGFVLICASVVYAFGLIKLPAPPMLTKPYQVAIAFFIGSLMVISPKTVEAKLEQIWGLLVDALKTLLKTLLNKNKSDGEHPPV